MKLLTAKEVSVILRVPVARVYELARIGLIPYVRLGSRQLRFDFDRLIELINDGRNREMREGRIDE